MSRRETTSDVVDEILKIAVIGGAFAAGLALPNMMVALEKPLKKFFRAMEERDKHRELRRIIYNMKERGYLSGSYEHGLHITDKARRRYDKIELDSLIARPQSIWDKSWRIVIYDIPEDKAAARRSLQEKLRQYGCFHLQKSVLITPFPCEADIAAIATQYDVTHYVTLFESHYIINQALLIARFQKKYPNTSF